MTEFVIRAITNKPITVVENAGELLTELKRQGNNLNQAVRNSHCNNHASAELVDCAKALREAYKSIVAAMGGAKDAAS